MDVTAILAKHGLRGDLAKVGGCWLLSGERGADGVSMQIEGEPDEAFIDQAAAQMVRELDSGGFGR